MDINMEIGLGDLITALGFIIAIVAIFLTY